jgi:hypothetical protein
VQDRQLRNCVVESPPPSYPPVFERKLEFSARKLGFSERKLGFSKENWENRN